MTFLLALIYYYKPVVCPKSITFPFHKKGEIKWLIYLFFIIQLKNPAVCQWKLFLPGLLNRNISKRTHYMFYVYSEFKLFDPLICYFKKHLFYQMTQLNIKKKTGNHLRQQIKIKKKPITEINNALEGLRLSVTYICVYNYIYPLCTYLNQASV